MAFPVPYAAVWQFCNGESADVIELRQRQFVFAPMGQLQTELAAAKPLNRIPPEANGLLEQFERNGAIRFVRLLPQLQDLPFDPVRPSIGTHETPVANCMAGHITDSR